MLIEHKLLKFKGFEFFNGKMPLISKRARHLKRAREIQAQKLEEKKMIKEEKLMKL